jgi:hypothetical protein
MAPSWREVGAMSSVSRTHSAPTTSSLVYVVVQLGQIELALLFVLMLCLALLDTPVPRPWALAPATLVAVQTAALHTLHEREATYTVEPAADASGGLAGVVAVVVVPALGAGVFAVVFWFFARANARTRGHLRRAAATPSAATCPPAAEPRPARPPASPAARRATVPPGPAQPGG